MQFEYIQQTIGIYKTTVFFFQHIKAETVTERLDDFPL